MAGAQIVRRNVSRDACRPHVGYKPHPSSGGASRIRKGRERYPAMPLRGTPDNTKEHTPLARVCPRLAVASQSVQESTAVQLLRYGRGHRSGSTPMPGMELPVFPHVHPANACGRRDATQLSQDRAVRQIHGRDIRTVDHSATITTAGATPSIPARPPPVVHAEKHAAEDHHRHHEQYRPNHPSISLPLIVNTCVTNPVSFSVSDVDTGCTPYISIYTDTAPVQGCALRAEPPARGRGGGFSLYITHYLVTC